MQKKKRENMETITITHIKEKNQSMKTNPEIIQMIELIDKHISL